MPIPSSFESSSAQSTGHDEPAVQDSSASPANDGEMGNESKSMSSTITIEVLEQRAAAIGAEHHRYFRAWPDTSVLRDLVNREWQPEHMTDLLDGVDADHRDMVVNDYSGQLFAIAVQTAHKTVEVVASDELRSGDEYRDLGRSGGYVLIGGSRALLECDEHDDAGKTIWRQIGEGEDAYRQNTGARGR